MIWESHYWKRDMLKYATALRRKMAQRTWREESEVIGEKTIFLGFYSVRKLLEAKKLSTRFAGMNILAELYPATGKNVTLMNWHKTDLLFDLDLAKKVSVSVPTLANQVVHSYIFHSVRKEGGGLTAILVTSDRQKKDGLLQIPVLKIVELFEAVGNDSPVRGVYRFDEKLGDYVVFRE